jgi:hypothetical protein
MEDITVKLTQFCLNYHPSGVKMLAKFTQRGIPVILKEVNMGWSDTMFQVLQLSVGMLSYKSIKSIESNQQVIQLNEKELSGLRDTLFKVYESGVQIMGAEEEKPLHKLINIGMLRYFFQKTGIDANVFPQFSDKEFILKLKLFLDQSYQQICSSLSPEEQLTGNHQRDLFISFLEYNQFIIYYSDGMKLITARNKLKDLIKNGTALTSNSQMNHLIQMIHMIERFVDFNSFIKVYDETGNHIELAQKKRDDIENEINRYFNKDCTAKTIGQ